MVRVSPSATLASLGGARLASAAPRSCLSSLWVSTSRYTAPSSFCITCLARSIMAPHTERRCRCPSSWHMTVARFSRSWRSTTSSSLCCNPFTSSCMSMHSVSTSARTWAQLSERVCIAASARCVKSCTTACLLSSVSIAAISCALRSVTAVCRLTRGCSMCVPISRQCAHTITPHCVQKKARAWPSCTSHSRPLTGSIGATTCALKTARSLGWQVSRHASQYFTTHVTHSITAGFFSQTSHLYLRFAFAFFTEPPLAF
mmetsp:Transcript_55022/g.130153  ORF Transcript_55022/g.130153 Transcript_55022/m.130153 type:complete len:259 (+) Transcript_55022:930-1706(+)